MILRTLIELNLVSNQSEVNPSEILDGLQKAYGAIGYEAMVCTICDRHYT